MPDPTSVHQGGILLQGDSTNQITAQLQTNGPDGQQLHMDREQDWQLQIATQEDPTNVELCPHNTLKILSWNTRGFGTEGRRRIVRNFIRKNCKDVDIIALQELKVTDKTKLEMSLRALMPEARIIVDYTPSGRGGAALLITSKLRASEVGTSQFGGAVSATVHTAAGSIRVASLHAPNTKEEMQIYWNWWDHQVDGEDWVIAGDFNNVELQDDSKGKSALMRGAEERAWKRFSYRTDMVDAYLTATNTEGGLFTRLAFCGARFDRARLDRFYLTNMGEWCDSIKQVKHYSDQLLSDHIPNSMDLQLVQDDDTNWKPRSYFKMNSRLFHKPEVLEAVKETWKEHPPFCRSSQKKWELAWGRVKQILRQERANNQLETRELDDLRREVQDLRIRSEQEELSSEAIQILKNCVAEIHIRETREAHLWKVRSKDRWLKEGEAPSKYFYLQLKAKFSREKITVLENVSGETMTKHSEILHEVQEYYRELYKRGSITPQVTHARDEVLRHLTRRITAVEDDTLIIIPTPEEIDGVVNGLSLGKSPGLDGITAEALRLVWTLVRKDCIDMVQEYWVRGALTEQTRTAVIKLLPKNDNTHLLKNWRPLSLMGLTYKILAKILANRIKPLMPKLVDKLQTGFIKGRNIASNLISLRLGQDWASISDQESMFVQLDFVKAYDRLEHGFLWQTLTGMGFSAATIKLIKGHAQGGLAKVHLNEDFTETLPIQRGVRQGCPLAPYLFTLTTQILMDTIQAGIDEGSIRGLQIDNNHQLVHRLFADDTGLFLEMNEDVFRAAREKITLFEEASGTLLNVQKSVIIPLGMLDARLPPPWLNETGCTIAAPGDRFKCLGLLSGSDVTNTKLKEQIKLLALPGYTLLSLGINNAGIKELENLSRQFLWGWIETGAGKKSLLAWDVFSQPKRDGGLGWGRLDTLAQAHLLRNILSLMRPNQDIWTLILQRILHTRVDSSRHPREIKGWTAQEFLLGLKSLKTPRSEFTNALLKTWFQARKFLSRLDKMFPPDQARNIALHESDGWEWIGPPLSITDTWSPPTHFLRALLHKDSLERPPLMTRWGRDGNPQEETNRWSRLWSAKICSRTKTRLWRFLRRAYFTNNRAREMKVSTGECARCTTEIETFQHALWNCPAISDRCGWVYRLLYDNNDRSRSSTHTRDMLSSIDTALQQANVNPAMVLLITAILRQNWKERNRQQFAGVKESLPHKILLQDVSNELKALEGNAARSADWKDALLRADLSLQRWTQLTTTNIDSGEVLTHDLSTSANAESINNRGRPPDTASLSIEVRHTPEDFQDAAEDPQSHDLPTMVSRLLHHYDDLLQQTPIWGDTARDGSRPM
ncbi:hypothetical protein R1sor_008599 [Riccia sorocarpa]|uniref:Reverse transcriptase domain-containing protein n=1 Tax=Riccia sorocarpa TaxID=122646 RepID=A0ABD3HU26_9MARC